MSELALPDRPFPKGGSTLLMSRLFALIKFS